MKSFNSKSEIDQFLINTLYDGDIKKFLKEDYPIPLYNSRLYISYKLKSDNLGYTKRYLKFFKKLIFDPTRYDPIPFDEAWEIAKSHPEAMQFILFNLDIFK